MVETNLPVLFLRDLVLFPYNELRMEFSKEDEKKILEISEKRHDNHILFVNLLDSLEEHPNVRKLPKIAILGKIKTKIELSNGIVRIVATGIDRVEIINYLESEKNIYEAFVIPTKDYDYDELEATALKRILIKDLNDYIELSSYVSNNVLGRINGINSLGRLSDIVAAELPIDYVNKYRYIETVNPISRIRMLIEDLSKEMETVKLENQIEDDLKNRLDDEQKNYILREKIKLIKEEINESDIKDSEIDRLNDKLKSLNLPDRIKNRLDEEMKRYELTPSTSPETSIVRNYIDWLISLPWNKSTDENNDMATIRDELNNSHCGLDTVKERILEYIAVSKFKKNNSLVLCLIGPPGTGKTSMAKSIAKALNRKFVKISVGGINDEGEIVGHRRTYMGANPGKIIQGIKKAGVNNPVFLIDEIDKLVKDYKGDPGAVLLDVLDKEQNNHFQDNYLEEDFDLSQILFILTGNDESKIPVALRDRLEIIKLDGYTLYEKIEMAQNYIIPKMSQEYSLDIHFTPGFIKNTIMYYTKEAGVRELTRCFDAVFRKIILRGKEVHTLKDPSDYLGNYKYKYLYNDLEKCVGVVNALGCSTLGGYIVKATSIMFSGNENVTITGSVSDTVKDSVTVAMSYIKANSKMLEISNNVFKNNDLHVHFEDAEIFKDGSSAGVTILTSLISAIREKPIDSDIGMTGEITLRGKVLPVGGIKEKIFGAINNNIKTIYIPSDNRDEVKEIDSAILKNVKIKYVSNYLEIYNDLF